MNIEYKEYRIEQDNVAPSTFNLLRLMTRTKKATGESYEEYEVVAYNMPLQNAITRLAMLEASKDNATYSLDVFLTKWKGISTEVKDAIKPYLEP